MILAWLGVLCVILLCGLDRTAIGQFQFGRPLVCSAAAGYLLGVFPSAFQLGLMMELLWLMRVPVGAAVAPDDTSATLGGVVLLYFFSFGTTQQDLVLVVAVAVVALVTAEIGKLLDIRTRHQNEKRFQNAVSHLAGQQWSVLQQNHLRCTVLFAMASLMSVVCVVAVGGLLLTFVLPWLMPLADGHPALLVVVFPLVGIAAMMAVLQVRKTIPLFVSGFLLTYGLLQLLEL
ncbi:PTS sugar transporter subunit IIC [Desulfuromonas acetoxidans]|uniref:PTS sugar transporter subunit IIC n=1 Tax=Desulfuromonas acetoxidans TaxID=891 RepID=UPI0029318F1C|nr:PTS sugar transporter subunit IIC [Desulfuromonas acetoxidans]